MIDGAGRSYTIAGQAKTADKRFLCGHGRQMASDKLSGERDGGLPAPAKRPTYVEVSSSIEAEIRNGMYPPGSRLPPQRQLATELGINVSTVSREY